MAPFVTDNLDGLLAFFDFNEGEGTRVSNLAMPVCASPPCNIDLSGMEHTGEVAWMTPGVCGSALEFYSVGDGSVVQTPVIEFGEAVTLSLWVFMHTSGVTSTADGGPMGSEQILNCNSHFLRNGHTGFTLALEASPGDGAWRTRTNDVVPKLSNSVTGGNLVPNVWTQLTVVFDPSLGQVNQLILYVDGVPSLGDGVGSGGWSGVWANRLHTSHTSSCAIGGHPSMSAYFDGLIDEVRIFDHGLSAGAVSNEAGHFWCNSLAASAPLLFFDFNEGGGFEVHDMSPYKNDLVRARAPRTMLLHCVDQRFTAPAAVQVSASFPVCPAVHPCARGGS